MNARTVGPPCIVCASLGIDDPILAETTRLCMCPERAAPHFVCADHNLEDCFHSPGMMGRARPIKPATMCPACRRPFAWHDAAASKACIDGLAGPHGQ